MERHGVTALPVCLQFSLKMGNIAIDKRPRCGTEQQHDGHDGLDWGVGLDAFFNGPLPASSKNCLNRAKRHTDQREVLQILTTEGRRV